MKIWKDGKFKINNDINNMSKSDWELSNKIDGLDNKAEFIQKRNCIKTLYTIYSCSSVLLIQNYGSPIRKA